MRANGEKGKGRSQNQWLKLFYHLEDLHAASKKIAEMKGISPKEVESTTTENTIRLFQLPITAEAQPR